MESNYFHDAGFNDVLYEWMSRAPWLAVSAVAHVIVILVLMAIPWDLIQRRERAVILSGVVPALDEPLFDEPPPEEQKVIEDELVEPQLIDSDLPEIEDEESVDLGDPSIDLLGTSGLDELAELENDSIIGIGPGDLGGPKGARFGQGRDRGGDGTEPALEAGLDWLARHQSPDGSWDCDGFMRNCPDTGVGVCSGAGEAAHDLGMTGLALLAFLGDGNTTRVGPHRELVARGVNWLRQQQDSGSGLFGQRIGHSFMYDHAIATLAMCEAYYFSKSPLIKGSAQAAIDFISRARNPYGAWRYDSPPTGENDTSVTAWMVFALRSAEDGGLVIDRAAYQGAMSWFDEVTEPGTARVGYDSVGSLSSRISGLNDHYPAESGEAMTASALLCRFFLGQDPADLPIMKRQAALLRAKLPEWDPDGLQNDMYYWYYGSYAMFQMGGSEFWIPWNKALKKAVLDSQRTTGDERGSWDPKDPWGISGGRVYSTALMVLCLEVYFRYARVLGAR